MVRILITKYKICAIGAVIALNCAVASVFKLEGVTFGLVVLAFCLTMQFFVNREAQDDPAENKPDIISENLFRRIMNIVPEVVYVSQFDGTMKYISDGIENLTGRKPDEIYRKRNFLLELVHADDREKVSKHIQKLLNGSEAEVEHRLLKDDGTYVWVSDHLNTIKNEWGNITHYYGILINIDEKKIHDKNLQNLNARLHQLNDIVNQHAVRDSLTNAYNKRYSLVILQNEFNRARVQNKPLSCILMDIDHFESINNQYGYFIGDRILIEISRCIQKHRKSSDIVSRFGNDEFLVILPEIHQEELDKVSSLLVKEIEKCCIKDEEKNISIPFHVTVGVGTITPETKNITDLIEQTSNSLYSAKVMKKVVRRFDTR